MTGRDYVLYFTAAFCWGTSWLALKVQATLAAPEPAVFWRFLLATLAMAAWMAIARADWRCDRAAHSRFALMGIGMFSTNFILYYHGGRLLTSGLLPVLFSLAVVGNLVMGRLFLGQAITGRLIAGAIVGILGVALLFSAEFGKTEADAPLWLGILLCLVGTIAFCIGNTASVLSSRAGIGVLPATTWGMVYGTLSAGLATLARGETIGVPLTIPFLVSMAWLVVVATVIAFAAYLTLVQRIGAARAGYVTVMFPVVGLFVSTFLETIVPGAPGNYVWTVASAVGLVLAIAGQVIVLRR